MLALSELQGFSSRRDLPDDAAAVIGVIASPHATGCRGAVKVAILVHGGTSERKAPIVAVGEIVKAGVGPAAVPWCQLENRAEMGGAIRVRRTIEVAGPIHNEIARGSTTSAAAQAVHQSEAPVCARPRQVEDGAATIEEPAAQHPAW